MRTKMAKFKVRGMNLEEIPCIQIDGGKWYKDPGFIAWLSLDRTATWSNKNVVKEKGRSSDCDDLFFIVDNLHRKEGQPHFEGEGEVIEEHCPEIYREIGEILIEAGFEWGVVWITPIDSEDLD